MCLAVQRCWKEDTYKIIWQIIDWNELYFTHGEYLFASPQHYFSIKKVLRKTWFHLSGNVEFNFIVLVWYPFYWFIKILHASDFAQNRRRHTILKLTQCKKSRTDTCVDVCCLTIVCNGRAMMRMEVACTARHKNDVYEIMFRLIETL